MSQTKFQHVLFLVSVLLNVVNCQQVCEDANPQGCQLFAQSLPNLCTDPTLSTTCKRYCGLCPVICYQCASPTRDPLACNVTQACTRDQTCLLSEMMSRDGHHEWVMQCVDKQVCEGVGYGFGPAVIGKRNQDHAIGTRDVTFKCCRTDKCNMPDLPTTPTTPMTFPTVATGQELACPKDIAIALDSSGSIGKTNFKYLLNFISDLIKLISMGPSNAQIALDTFSTHVYHEWYLDDYNKTEMLEAVKNVTYHSGATHTGEALLDLLQKVFTPANGDRPSVPDAALIITDGNSNNKQQTIDAAKKLHAASSDVVAVGVGSGVSDTELRTIASDGQRKVRVRSIRYVSSVLNRVAHLLCL